MPAPAVPAAAATVRAVTPPLQPALSGVGFLVGHWSTGGRNPVQETGGSATGESRITVAAGGAALLRQDHTDLYDAAGKPAGGFDILMMIYPDAGTLRADYFDGSHAIHYTSATIVPMRSATFYSAASAAAPRFRLTYTLSAPKTLAVAFAMLPPGGSQYRPIATGTLHEDAE